MALRRLPNAFSSFLSTRLSVCFGQASGTNPLFTDSTPLASASHPPFPSSPSASLHPYVFGFPGSAHFASSMSECYRGHATAAQSAEVKEENREIVADILTPFITHKIDSPPDMHVQTDVLEVMEMFRQMNVIRRAEITADTLYKQQLIRGFCHLYDGQEAVAIGTEAALTSDDSVLTAYRDHGIFLARGGTPYELFCELMGRARGPARGKGGSMHLYHKAHNFYGGWGIVGTTGPLGTGLALGHKLAKKTTGTGITLTVYGDGAANQGQIYEAQNMAALWKLPVVYMVENNHYGMGTSESRASAEHSFYDRLSYMPGMKVNGMDVFAVKKAMAFAKEHALQKGPIILEMDTYRYHGHSMTDPGGTYRTRSEIRDIRSQRDCIGRLRQLILKEGIHTEEELKSIEKEVRKEVEEASQKARQAPSPPDGELWEHVYRFDQGIVHKGVNPSEGGVHMP